MALTKVSYSMINGSTLNVKDFGAKGDGVTDDYAAITAANTAAAASGNSIFFPVGVYLSSQTLICQTPWFGVNTENYWDADGTGTIIKATGAGIGAKWTDINGSDAATFKPLVVVGRPDITIRDLTLKHDATAWSAGLFIPGLRRVQLTNVDCIGDWTEGGLYLDATWSSTNTTLTSIHPEILADDALNEINVQGGLYQGTTWGIRLQGTTRNPDDYTEEQWVWCPGGASDVVFMASRTVSISIDAAIKNAAKTVQGIRFYSVDTRAATRPDMMNFDRANRVEIYGSYGETTSGTAKVSFTSRTGYVTFYGGRYTNNLVYLNGVSTGAVLSSAPIPSIPNLSFYAYDGQVFLGHGVNLSDANVYPSTDNTGSLGSSALNWAGARVRLIRTDSGALNLRGVTSVGVSPNSSAIDYIFESLVFKPGTDNTQSLGNGTNRWSVVYAGTGAINTSDARTKQDVAALDEVEKRVATELKGLIKKFRFKDAVNAKGDSARIHIGVIAQEVISAFQQEGLNAADYGILCYDEWAAQPEQRNEEGEITSRAVEAGNRYGIRYEELFAFILSAI